VDGQVGGDGDAAGGQLLEDQGGAEARQAEAAVRLVDVQAKVVLLGGPASRRQWKVTFAVPGDGYTVPVRGWQRSGHCRQQALFLGEFEIHRHYPCLSLLSTATERLGIGALGRLNRFSSG